jgi:hypothetical protein
MRSIDLIGGESSSAPSNSPTPRTHESNPSRKVIPSKHITYGVISFRKGRWESADYRWSSALGQCHRDIDPCLFGNAPISDWMG